MPPENVLNICRREWGGIDMEDEQIIEMLWQRQENGLAEVKLKYERLCWQTAQHILTLPDDISECLNDAYFQLWQLIPPQRPQHLPAFLLRVVRNLALKRYAYNSAQKRCPEVSLSLSELAEVTPSATALDEELNRGELLAAINSFLRQQNKLNRQLFLRRYWYFNSLDELAGQSGLSNGAVAARLCRMRAALKVHLQKEGFNI